MLNANNPFRFASSSAADPLAPADPIATAPGMPQSFVWSHLLVTLADVPAQLPAEPEPAPEPAPAAIPAAAEAIPEPAIAAPPALIAAPPALIAAPPTLIAAPAPALVIIAEPAALPAPVGGFVPTQMPQDPNFDAYARLFQGIENRDLLADLQATLAPGSDWANAFGPPLG